MAEPHLEALVAEVNESSSVSVLDGDDVVYVARVPVSRIMTVAISVGTRFPAYATSMGRVLLAGLPDEELDAYLAKVKLDRLTAADGRPRRPRCGPSWPGCGRRASPWSTRNSRRACGPWPPRSATGPAGWSPSLNISAHASRTSLETMRRNLLPPLLAAAARISADLPANSRSGRP